jgi:hypothetical protein
MTYQIITYRELSSHQKTIFFNFLKEASTEITQPAHTNMWDDDWVNKNHTLPYLLEKTDRFNGSGEYNILFNGDAVIASSGVYVSNFCPDLVIAGTRTWIHKSYRNKSIARDYLLTTEKSWAIQNNYKAIGICFNDYNKNIINIWKRKRLGENRTTRQSHHLLYNGVNEVPFPVTIQYTKQYIIYEVLHSDFYFDWDTIRNHNF